MDKLVAFFKNVWFRRAVAVICWAYTALMVWLTWLNFGYHIEFLNPTPLFVLYVFINVAALGLMILTRKQVITQINAYVLPVIVFVLIIFGFGRWYITTPPLVVVVAIFFINKSNETLKTVLGTMFLLLYVIGVVGFIAVRMFIGDFFFSLDEDGNLTISELDMKLRDADYENISPSGDYRIVRYINDSGERKTVSYYVEYTRDDVEMPMAICKKTAGCRHLHTAAFTSADVDHVRWGTTTVEGKTADALYVENLLRENPYLRVRLEDSSDSDGESSKVSRPSLINPVSSQSASSSDESE